MASKARVDCTGDTILKTETEIKRPKDVKKADVILWGKDHAQVQNTTCINGVVSLMIDGVWERYGDDQWLEVVLEEDEEQGVKHDEDKPRFSLVPTSSLRAIVDVLTYGAKKYPSADNWKRVDNAKERYTDALLRHMYAWMDGETLDPESGLHHLAHAGCCVLFLLHFEITGGSL